MASFSARAKGSTVHGFGVIVESAMAFGLTRKFSLNFKHAFSFFNVSAQILFACTGLKWLPKSIGASRVVAEDNIRLTRNRFHG